MGLRNFQSQSTLAFKFAMHTKEEEGEEELLKIRKKYINCQ